MAYSLKENLMKEDRLSGGHRMCAGCGSPIAVRTVLRALNPEDKAVVCSATSCLEVSTAILVTSISFSLGYRHPRGQGAITFRNAAPGV